MQQPENAVPHDSGWLTGIWEAKKRNPVVAALIVLFGVGAIYTYGSAILTFPVFLFAQATGGAHWGEAGFAERIKAMMESMALPMQATLFISQFAFLLAPTVYLAKKLHTRDVRRYIRLKPVPIVDVLLGVLIAVAFLPASGYIENVFSGLIEFPDWFNEYAFALFKAHSFPEFVWLILAIAVTPAICEETLFRGYAQRTMERGMGVKSVWVVGALFGLYHQNPLGLVSLSLVGFILGYLFYRSKSMYPSMAAHFTNNAVIIWLMYSEATPGGVDVLGSDGIPFGWFAASICATAVLLWVYHLQTRGRSDEDITADSVAG